MEIENIVLLSGQNFEVLKVISTNTTSIVFETKQSRYEVFFTAVACIQYKGE